MEAVGELDEDDAHVLRHRDDHLPVVLGLGLLAALERDPRQLRDAFDELRDLVAERAANLLEIGARVLDHVVQERGGDRVPVEMQLGADACDPERMVDELPARAPRLPLACPFRDHERVPQEVAVDLRVVRTDLGNQLLDEVFVMPLGIENTHGVSVLRPIPKAFLVEGGGSRVEDALHGCARRWLRQRSRDGWQSRCATRSSRSADPLARSRGARQRPRTRSSRNVSDSSSRRRRPFAVSSPSS